jgi:hypothetical protein
MQCTLLLHLPDAFPYGLYFCHNTTSLPVGYVTYTDTDWLVYTVLYIHMLSCLSPRVFPFLGLFILLLNLQIVCPYVI